MDTLVWVYVAAVAGALGFWLWLVLSPSRRGLTHYQFAPADVASHPYRLQGRADDAPAAAPPPVAILCPGRNEADHIPRTLPKLCEQDHPRYRVVYIDDDSEDATPAITARCVQRYPHLTVVRNTQPPPAGWVGKCWAVHQGYERLVAVEGGDEAERAQWVCFTDADIDWDPRCLTSALALADQTGADVVGLFPHMVMGTTVERMGMATMMLALGVLFPLDKAMDPREPRTLTGGAFILTRRALYDRIGGHESVKGQIVEDVHLGQNLKAAGGRVRLAIAPELLSTRMYEGWSDMWEGLTKNAYAGMEYKWYVAVLVVLATLVANILPPVYVAAALAWTVLSDGQPPLALALLGASVLTVLLQALAMRGVCRQLDLPWPYWFSVPAGSAIYLLFILGSIWRYYRGGNVWKGRAYGKAGRKMTG